MMRKFLLLLFFIITTVSFAQIVTIPDVNFKAKLISLGIDTNTDGDIQESEALAVTNLDVSSSSISDLTGIESFLNLTNLNCSQNNLTTLNLNALTNLTVLNAGSNLISILNISSLVNLTTLNVDSNLLTSFDFSGLTNLMSLNCVGNLNLTSMNVSGLVNLQELFCNANNLSFLGLNGLINLVNLKCDKNLISSLDVSDLVSLQVLDCSTNQLSSLNLTGLTQLTQLNCSQNQIAVLDLAGLTNLTFVRCYDNLLTMLDVSFTPGVTELNCNSNQLTTIDVSGLNNLATLSCINNQLTTLNINNLPNLLSLACENNQLTTLDLSTCPLVQGLHCDFNQLETLFLKNGTDEPDLSFANNPNLSYICVDDSQLNAVQSQLNTLGMTNTACNSYCSFVPGGNYNTIQSNVQLDIDNNGCDSSDPTYSNIKFILNDGTNQSATFTNDLGQLNFYTQVGNFTLTPSIENATWFNFSPASVAIPFANNNNNVVPQNFCVTPIGVHSDIEIVVSPVLAEPDVNTIYNVVIKNNGNQTLNGEFSLNFDDVSLDFITASPALPILQDVGLLKWSYSDLKPFESRSTEVVFFINALPPSLGFSVSTNPLEGDELPLDNTFSFNQNADDVFLSNTITCLQGELLPVSQVGQFLHYEIKFQNSGSTPAENVVVRLDISALDFDIDSLQALNSSSQVYIRQTGNVVEIIFQGINIDSGGHGNVLIKIKSNGTLPVNYTISEFADIFFDYELPLETNFEEITIKELSNPPFTSDSSIVVYPNPTSSMLNIKCNNTIKSIQLYDVHGRLLQTQILDSQNTAIDVSQKEAGVYFVKVTSENGVKVERIIKE